MSLGTACEEMAAAIGKKAVMQRKQSLYTMGALQLLWGIVIFIGTILFFPASFSFSWASLPTFAIRTVLEVVQAHVTILAITRADRTTYSFFRLLTLPLLLAVDVALGYAIHPQQLLGMGLIMPALMSLFFGRVTSRAGIGFVLFSALNAVATLSLYKYDIAHFNSVVGEQFPIYLVMFGYFIGMAWYTARENPFARLQNPLFFFQSIEDGLGGVLQSFAYHFGPASIITAAKRSFAVLWSMIAGHTYFQEKNIWAKGLFLLVVSAGIALMVL